MYQHGVSPVCLHHPSAEKLVASLKVKKDALPTNKYRPQSTQPSVTVPAVHLPRSQLLPILPAQGSHALLPLHLEGVQIRE